MTMATLTPAESQLLQALVAIGFGTLAVNCWNICEDCVSTELHLARVIAFAKRIDPSQFITLCRKLNMDDIADMLTTALPTVGRMQ
jgi:hypothetical protein